MVLYILRGVFILLVTAVAMLYILPFQEAQALTLGNVLLMTLTTIGLALVVIAVDVFTPRKKLSALSGIFLGLVSGLLAAYALSFVVDLAGLILVPEQIHAKAGPTYNLMQGAKVLIGLVSCYVGMSLVLQTKDDFRFVLPYIEFARQIRGSKPMVLDTSVIVDGRILDIVETNMLQGGLVVPRFVLQELQTIADSADKLRRARGRRGLDVLQKLQNSPLAQVSLHDSDADGTTVDQKLVSLASELGARLMTNDFNLAKVAGLRGVDVVNLNELTKALRPVVLPGEKLSVKVLRPGEGPTQGVGYLDDGTMVVVENARPLIGQQVDLTVTSTLQTSAGRMIFGRAPSAENPPGDRAGGESGR